MQPGEIYLAQNARFSGEFAAGFTGLTPHLFRTRPGHLSFFDDALRASVPFFFVGRGVQEADPLVIPSISS